MLQCMCFMIVILRS